MSNLFPCILTSACVLALLSAPLEAADIYWDGPNTSPTGSITGGSGTWDNSLTNWTNATGTSNKAWDAADSAIFSGSAGTVSVTESIAASGIAFQTDGYALTGSGALSINGPSLTIATATDMSADIVTSISGSGALVKIGAGTLTLSGTTSHTGDSYGLGTVIREGTLAVTGGTIDHELAETVVGWMSGDQGTLKIGSGGTIISNDSFIGFGAGAVGTATVDGGTWSNSGDLVMGQNGNGHLTIKNGGSVTSHNGYIAGVAGNTGSVLVEGGTWQNSNTLSVGSLGTGTMDITDEGLVSSHYVHIGEGADSEGTVNVTSGQLEISTSTAIANSLFVGMLGKGTLNIASEGVVTSAAASVGDQAGSEGHIAVDGGSWNTTDFIVIGNSGTGTLTLTNGGQVTNANRAFVGYGGTGTVTVDGSEWKNTALTLGYEGTAILNVRGEGNVTVGGVIIMADGPDSTAAMTIGDTSPLTPSIDGTVSASQIVRGLGAASITLNGGLLQARADQDDFLSEFDAGDVVFATGGAYFDTNGFAIGIQAVLSGVGGFTKIGSGTLTLSAANTYTGSTTVKAGTLLITGDSSASASVHVENGGTLGGEGKVHAVTVDEGGTLAADTLTIEEDLTLSTGSVALFQGGDQVDVGGLLTLEDDWTLTLTSGFQDGGSTIFFTYGSLAALSDLTPNFDLTALGFIPTGELSLTDTGSSIILNGVSAIPEPATGVLVAGGVLLLLLRRQRDTNA